VEINNPYASPLFPGRLSAAASDIPTAWRDGAALVVRREDSPLPKACIKSNHEGWLLSYSITTLSDRSGVVVLGLFALPFVGLLVGCLAVVMLLRAGKGASTNVWLRPRIGARFWCYDLAVVLLVLGGNLLSGAGLLQGRLDLLIAGAACTASGIVLSMLPCQALGLLRFELTPPDLVYIHGANPEYLDRLPAWQRGDAAMAIDTVASAGELSIGITCQSTAAAIPSQMRRPGA
jgi:hypothetical protein